MRLCAVFNDGEVVGPCEFYDGIHIARRSSNVRDKDSGGARRDTRGNLLCTGVERAWSAIGWHRNAAHQRNGHHATWIGDRGNDDLGEWLQLQRT